LIKQYFSGVVPGDIFTDLHRQGVIPDLLFGDNHLHFRWISSENWTYTKSFEVDKNILKFSTLLLRLKGVDTISSVVLNGVALLKTNNQFVEYVVNVGGVLAEHNQIQVHFSSPVSYAAEKSKEYERSHGHLVPPVCPPTIFNGECHPNFIRKAQYSFSWDWGPSFPTVGIWKPVDIIAFNGYFIDDISWTTERTAEFWVVHGEAQAFMDSKAATVGFDVEIESLDISRHFTYNITEKVDREKLKFDIKIPLKKVKLWWPNGQGQQKLYTIKLRAEDREISRRIGFRHVELIQDYIDAQQKDKGRHFYFKVNDRPVFLKVINHSLGIKFCS
ncbi:glycoside hydrolase, family 2, partial [Oesophagostomum dentatum]